jgi:hypothetical protein
LATLCDRQSVQLNVEWNYFEFLKVNLYELSVGRPKIRKAYEMNMALRKIEYEIKRWMKRGPYLVLCRAPVLAATI